MIRLLAEIWQAAGYLCGPRLKAAIPQWRPWLKRRTAVSPELAAQRQRMSPRQIERRLRDRKQRVNAGIDLRGTNSVIVVVDHEDRVQYQQRLRNELTGILAAFAPFRETLEGIAVESTYNWYWLVDGLMDAGYRVHQTHVPALPQYSGLKHTDDHDDARWLAHLLRLGLLPTGHIYRKPSGRSGISCASVASSSARRPSSS